MAESLTREERQRRTERAFAAVAILGTDATSEQLFLDAPINVPEGDVVGVTAGDPYGWGSLVGDPSRVCRFVATPHMRGVMMITPAGYELVGPSDYAFSDVTLASLGTGTLIAESDRPFERLDEQNDEGARLRRLLSCVSDFFPASYRDRLVSRVQMLSQELAEEDPGRVPSVESFQALLNFLVANPKLKFPHIVLTADGFFRAEWHRSKDYHLAVTFLLDGDVRFVVFAKRKGARLPSPLAKVDRQSGITSLDRLMEVLAPFAIRRWVE